MDQRPRYESQSTETARSTHFLISSKAFDVISLGYRYQFQMSTFLNFFMIKPSFSFFFIYCAFVIHPCFPLKTRFLICRSTSDMKTRISVGSCILIDIIVLEACHWSCGIAQQQSSYLTYMMMALTYIMQLPVPKNKTPNLSMIAYQ